MNSHDIIRMNTSEQKEGTHPMNEEDLKTILIRDLHTKGVNVINMRNGTFDVLLEGSNPLLLELKIITNTTKKTCPEPKEKTNRGITLTEEQIQELSKTTFPIYILATDAHNYYLFDPKWVKTQAKDLQVHNKTIIEESRWNDTDWTNIPPITYDTAINTLLKILYRR